MHLAAIASDLILKDLGGRLVPVVQAAVAASEQRDTTVAGGGAATAALVAADSHDDASLDTMWSFLNADITSGAALRWGGRVWIAHAPSGRALGVAGGGTAEEEGMGEAYRSRNERLHARLLAAEFAAADGWTVRFEPETLLDVHEPSVVDGARRADITRSYTCDFVALRGAQRLCIESKPCEEHVTAEALHKCRVLRDRTLTRVVVMAGAHAPRWLDVGAVDAPPEAAVWHADAAALKAALGL